MTSLLYVSENCQPPPALEAGRFDIATVTGVSHLLEFLSHHPVDVVLLDRRTWKLSARTISRWVKTARRSARIILLSDTLLMPDEIPANIDAVISTQASAELVTATITAVLPPPSRDVPPRGVTYRSTSLDATPGD